jgi:uncharacterized repeat protein (TIGR01451 family)
MRSCPRIVPALAALLGALAATPALAQSSDVQVTLVAPPDKGSTFQTVTFSAGGAFTATVKNNGPNIATGVALKPTLTPATSFPSSIAVAFDGDGCTTDATTSVTTCTVTGAGGVAGQLGIGESVDVSLSLAPAFPDDPSTITSCPDPSSLGTVSVAVSSTTTDPAAGNNTATVTSGTGAGQIQLGPFADVAADLTGPSRANVGDNINYTVTVTNNGPCPADNVVVADGSTAGIEFQSGTPPCASFDAKGNCKLGTLAVGQKVTFNETFKVAGLQQDVTSTGDPNAISVSSDTDDPDDTNNAPSTTTLVRPSSGCATGGSAAPWALALLALAFLARRYGKAA